MGHCCDKHKIHVIESTDHIPLNTVTVPNRYHLMISYASSDQVICRRLVNHLIKDKFHVWFHPDPNENEFNPATYKIIDNSDCIVMCMSDTYAQTYRCQKEARYASDMHKRIIMVKVASDYKMNDWLSFVKPGKIQYELCDDNETFEATYKQLAVELKRVTKSHSFISHRSWELSVPVQAELPHVKERKQRLHQSDLFYQKLIERPWCFNAAMAEGSYAWDSITGFIGSAVRTDEDMIRRHQLDSDLSIMVKRRQQLSSYFKADSQDHFCKFAERMRQNMIDWEKFCNI